MSKDSTLATIEQIMRKKVGTTDIYKIEIDIKKLFEFGLHYNTTYSMNKISNNKSELIYSLSQHSSENASKIQLLSEDLERKNKFTGLSEEKFTKSTLILKKHKNKEKSIKKKDSSTRTGTKQTPKRIIKMNVVPQGQDSDKIKNNDNQKQYQQLLPLKNYPKVLSRSVFQMKLPQKFVEEQNKRKNLLDVLESDNPPSPFKWRSRRYNTIQKNLKEASKFPTSSLLNKRIKSLTQFKNSQQFVEKILNEQQRLISEICLSAKQSPLHRKNNQQRFRSKMRTIQSLKKSEMKLYPKIKHDTQICPWLNDQIQY